MIIVGTYYDCYYYYHYDPLHTIGGTANYIFALEITIIIVEITGCASGCCRRRYNEFIYSARQT